VQLLRSLVVSPLRAIGVEHKVAANVLRAAPRRGSALQSAIFATSRALRGITVQYPKDHALEEVE
jgi:hypothetical protein